jgi:hypothetical protein
MKHTYDSKPAPLGPVARIVESVVAVLLALIAILLPRSH